jgi:hypothetical protein
MRLLPQPKGDLRHIIRSQAGARIHIPNAIALRMATIPMNARNLSVLALQGLYIALPIGKARRLFPWDAGTQVTDPVNLVLLRRPPHGSLFFCA